MSNPNKDLANLIKTSKALSIAKKHLFDRPKETIADAIIDAGPDADYTTIAESLEIPEQVIKDFVQSNDFLKYLKKRMIQRGYDSIRTQEDANLSQHKLMKMFE